MVLKDAVKPVTDGQVNASKNDFVARSCNIHWGDILLVAFIGVDTVYDISIAVYGRVIALVSVKRQFWLLTMFE